MPKDISLSADIFEAVTVKSIFRNKITCIAKAAESSTVWSDMRGIVADAGYSTNSGTVETVIVGTLRICKYKKDVFNFKVTEYIHQRPAREA